MQLDQYFTLEETASTSVVQKQARNLATNCLNSTASSVNLKSTKINYLTIIECTSMYTYPRRVRICCETDLAYFSVRDSTFSFKDHFMYSQNDPEFVLLLLNHDPRFCNILEYQSLSVQPRSLSSFTLDWMDLSYSVLLLSD